MSEQLAPMPAAEAAKAKPRRAAAAIPLSVSTELTPATEVAAAAEKTVYATKLAEEGIDAAFVTGLRAKIAAANALVPSRKTHAATRVEFKLSPNRALQ